MAVAKVDYRELQAEELSRYKTLDKVYAFETRNPAGMRFTNLQRAFNATAASKLVGWPSTIDPGKFLASVCDNIRDYMSGSYLATLPDYRQAEFANPQTAETWFDYVQMGLYLALYAADCKTIAAISNWVKFDMLYDSGLEEVSMAINRLYEQLCGVLRGEVLVANFERRFEEGARLTRERPLAAMLVALSRKDLKAFTGSLDLVITSHRSKSSELDKILSLEASSLCNAWIWMHGSDLDFYRDVACLHIRPSTAVST